MPMPNRKMPKASMNKRWLKAKSTTARIIYSFLPLLLRRGLEGQGVRQHLPARLYPRHSLHSAGERPPALHLDAPEFTPARGHIDPVAVVEVEDCRCRHGSVRLLLLGV